MSPHSSTRPGRKKWWHEPLLQFVFLGGLAFSLHHLLFGSVQSEYVRSADAPIEQFRQDWFASKGAAPSAAEEAALVEEWIEEEVLYRRAVELGIDQNDTIVRRRLVQRMRFLLEDTSHIAAPSDTDLQAWLGQHPARFAAPERISFAHFFFSRGGRGERLGADAQSALKELERDPEASIEADPFFRGSRFTGATPQEIARAFGPEFAAELAQIPLGRWSGPVKSAYGLHLVNLSERLRPTAADLDTVREAVERDWLQAEHARHNQEAVDALRRRYSPPESR